MFSKLLSLFFALFLLQLTHLANAANDTLIYSNTSWKYLDDGSNQGTAWTGTSYNDALWSNGVAQFGYGDGDEATVVSYGPSASNKYITTYFRKTFNIANPNDYTNLKLNLLRDDGAVVYINGIEVSRNNLPVGSITNTTLASFPVNNANENTYVVTSIASNMLIAGTNTIAVEVHQNAANSNDLSFNFFMIGLQSCGVPIALASSNITTNSAALSWSNIPSVLNYTLQYRKSGVTAWTKITTSPNSYNLSSLLDNTTYQWRVRSNCNFGSSNFTAIQSFTTASASCNIATGLLTNNINESSALLNWNSVGNASSYDVQYRIVGAPTWSAPLNTVNASLPISGLAYSTNYEWQVRTNCVFGNQSAYSGSANFITTTPPCNSSAGQSTTAITATTATANWSAVTGASSYDVQYREVGAVNWNAAINTLSPSLSLSLLNAATNYEWQVRTNCIYGNQSGYSTSTPFTTLAAGPCNTPTGLSIASVTTTGATASWSAVSGSIGYSVRYRPIGNANWTTISSATTSLALTGLATSKTYEVQVATNCSGNTSTFSSSVDFTTSAATTILTRSTYLQMVTPTSIHIRWKSSASTNSLVRFGTDMSLPSSASNATSTTDHEVVLTALSPGTKYYYSIGSSTVDYQGDANNYFLTSLTTGSTAPFRVWATGDFGNNSTGQANTRNAMETYTAGNRPNFWIWMGDNAYNAGLDAEYQSNVFNIYPAQMKSIPIYPCLGNHDYANVGYKSASALTTNFPYFSIFSCPTAAEAGGVSSGTEKYYSYNYGNAHFIVLDSYGALNASGSPMYNWLQSDLIANTQKWKIVMWHHAPYTMGTHNSDTEAELVDMRNNINPLLEQYKVDLVLTGHSHVYERSWLIKGHFGLENSFINSMKVDTTNGLSPYYQKSSATNFDGTVYCVCGVSGQGGSVTTVGSWPHASSRQYSKSLFGSMIIDFNGDTLDAKFVTSSATVYDRFKIVKTGFGKTISGATDEEANVVSVYPNPFSNDLTIHYKVENESSVTIELFDLMGRKIYSNQNNLIIQPSGNYELKLTEKELGNASGILLLKYTNGNTVISRIVERSK